MLLRLLYLVPFLIGGAVALPAAKRAAPSIQLDKGTFVGSSDGTVDKFLGIPFAKPPCVSPAHCVLGCLHRSRLHSPCLCVL